MEFITQRFRYFWIPSGIHRLKCGTVLTFSVAIVSMCLVFVFNSFSYLFIRLLYMDIILVSKKERKENKVLSIIFVLECIWLKFSSQFSLSGSYQTIKKLKSVHMESYCKKVHVYI